jgi:peptidoglycan/xylan/chitin deacetylase (PgdA/CDA1 family)
MKSVIIGIVISLLQIVAVNAQQESWQGKRYAVVLTYDDALNVHVNNVLPALDSAGLRATFYVSDYFNGLRAQIPAWRHAAAKGHELGNHTIHHPCLGGTKGREFVSAENDMNNYSIERIIKEIRAMNTLLYAIDGKTRRTFAYPCGDRSIRDTNYIEKLKDEFNGARGVQSGMPRPADVDLWNISCYSVNGQTLEQLIGAVNEARKKGGLLVFLFHGVGGEHSLNIDLETHRGLLQYLKQQEADAWITTMVEAAEYITSSQKGRSSKK